MIYLKIYKVVYLGLSHLLFSNIWITLYYNASGIQHRFSGLMEEQQLKYSLTAHSHISK